MRYFIFILLIIYIIILLLRFIFTFLYYKREKEKTENIKKENRLSLKEVTIFQPVLSGDSYLEEKLSIIYNTAKEAGLIWAVDNDDREAERIINKITNEKVEEKNNIKKIMKTYKKKKKRNDNKEKYR